MIVAVPLNIMELLLNMGLFNFKMVSPGDVILIVSVIIAAERASSIGLPSHAKRSGKVGYVLLMHYFIGQGKAEEFKQAISDIIEVRILAE